MKKEALKRHNRRAARSNAKFEGLDKAGKRVYIAKDVLKQLASRKLKATPGTYFAGKVQVKTTKDFCGDKEVDQKQEVQEVVQKMKSCNACALGSVFACAVGIADDLKMADINPDFSGNFKHLELSGGDMYDYLKRFFTEKQLSLIESAFECRDMGDKYEAPPALVRAREVASNFGTNFKKPKDRMVAIMANIIENDGSFKPPVLERKPNEQWVGEQY